MSTSAPQLHPRFIIPTGVRYDGPQTVGRRTVHLFTVTDTQPLEATFSLPEALCSSVAIARETARKRQECRTPTLPLPPLYQRQPRIFCAPDYNHSH